MKHSFKCKVTYQMIIIY